MNTKPLKAYSLDELSEILTALGQPSFRARQILEWVYLSKASSYEEMSNLPKELRATLSDLLPLHLPQIINRQVSKDGTRKYVLEFYDGARAETVAIPSSEKTHEDIPKRITVCTSTQAGCAMACSFCATGTEGLTRNLLSGEILDQIMVVQEDMGLRVSNVVTMGQGEPFANYKNTLNALDFASDPKGFSIGSRHITISTCGIIEGINKLAQEPRQYTLAVSLHSAIQETRDLLMPRIAHQNLNILKKSLSEYVATTNRRVSLEYIMIDGVNDTPKHRKALIAFCDNLLCHVNLLPVNTASGRYSPSSQKTIKNWIKQLEASGTQTTVRNSRGSDISGACGQLKNKL